MKLHLGCGKLKLDGYINIDLFDSDFDHDIRDFRGVYDDATIDEIYICHVLEHFGRRELIDILKEYKRILKPDGLLRIAVPDLEHVIKLYNEDKKNIYKIMGLLYGGQKNEHDYHKFGFTFDTLYNILTCVGFCDIKRYDTWEFLNEKQDDYSKSYIPHMDKTGTLVSLNITCKNSNNTTKLNEDVCLLIKKNTICI